jgi:hypothetical protein
MVASKPVQANKQIEVAVFMSIPSNGRDSA